MNDAADIAPLTGAQKRQLRGLAHNLDSVVQLGQRGLTAPVQAEIDRALEWHELIKVRLAGSRAEKDDQVSSIVDNLAATLIQRIGHLAVLYRPNPEGGPVSDLLVAGMADQTADHSG